MASGIRGLDDRFGGVNNARVTAEVTSPAGTVSQVMLPWSVEADGRYQATIQATEAGMYEVRVRSEQDGTTPVAAQPAYVEVAPSTSEYATVAQ